MRRPTRAFLVTGLGLTALALCGPGCTQRIGAGPGLARAGTGGRAGMDAGAAIGGTFGDASSPNGGHAGSAGMRNGPPTGAGGASATCTFMAASSTSAKIPTVGIVTFTTTLTRPTEAHIDFGLDTSYGMTAPVDLNQPSYRTLLLGMKPARTYHFRIVATNGNDVCASADDVIDTGALPAGLLPPLTVTTVDKRVLYGGFLVFTQYRGAIASGTPAAIVDADGDYVWWYPDALTDPAGARLTADGGSMWINSANIPRTAAQVHKVTMDGATNADFSIAFAGAHHQLAPLPDGSVAFCAYDPASGCDDIKLFPANGTTNSSATTVVNANAAHGGTGACQCSGIAYGADDDTLVFSDLDDDCVTKITRNGSTVWVLNGGANGTINSFSGDTWTGGVHGLQVLSPADILMFANNSATGSGSMALEMRLDTSALKATKAWPYVANPAIQVDVMGDVQRLPNGNTVVAYSSKGELQEVDANGVVLQDIKWPAGASFGYIEKRRTLYGPPIR
jgi:Arylsulfotransferase (ASST)